MVVGAAESIGMSAGTTVQLDVGESMGVQTGGSLSGRVGSVLDLVTGSTRLESAGAVDVTGADMSLLADGDVTGYTTGAAAFGSDTLSGSVTSDAAGLIGGGGHGRRRRGQVAGGIAHAVDHTPDGHFELLGEAFHRLLALAFVQFFHSLFWLQTKA